MADWRSGIKEAVSGLRGKIRFDEPLAHHTTFRIGGPADVFITAETPADIILAMQAAKAFNRACFILGGGSNLLVADEGFRGVVLTLGKSFQYITIVGNRVEAGAAVRLPALVETCCQHALTGIEFLTGIPAQFGGALKSNSGAFGNSLGDVVESITGITEHFSPAVLVQAELGFGYHVSRLPHGFVITAGSIALRPAEPDVIEKNIARVREHRQKTQPAEPSAGCIFRNPPGERAGRLIDQAGLKGRYVGGAKISEKHANFIINQGTARFSDVLRLIDEIKRKVEQETGFKLEEEIIILKGDGIDED
jgi:UDP-N-acetylmuramate dehydrogenase